MTIAIIGGGLSGTLTAIHLLRNATCNTKIYLIEQDRYKMNRGIAYSSQLDFQPLNVPVSAMSLFPEKPLDFYHWLKKQEHCYARHLKQPLTERDFVPRFIFGDYLKYCLQDAEMQASKETIFIKVYDEAISIKKQGKTFCVSFRENESINATKVVLAPGNFPPGNLKIRNKAFYNSDKYVASPWAAKSLANLCPEAPVLLIGSSLTMVDLAGTLQAQGHTGKIYVISRHGLLPQAFDVNTLPYPNLNLHVHPSLTVSELYHFISHEITKAKEQGYTWRSVLDAMREAIPTIWQAFPEEERKRFLRHLRPYWETHRHRMPAGSATLLTTLQQQGRMEIIAANILNMTDKGELACITIKRKKKAIPEIVEVSRVINCTGPQSDFRQIKTPLITQLLADNMIQPDNLGLGLLTKADGTLIGKTGTAIEHFYTLGPPRKATLYESTALREIRMQAKELAGHLLQENTSFEKKIYVS